ncbi:MAG TPA: glycine cleavage system protein H [Burkholderiales bacterium]
MIELHGCKFPETLYYHVEHNVWVRRDDDGLATVGATSYGCALAGEFMGFVPKPVGTFVARDRGFAVVELFKVVHAVHAPLSGRIVAVNSAAEADPALIMRDPYGEGWMVRFEPADWAGESAALLTGGDAIAAAFRERMRLDGFPNAAAPGG